MGPINQNMVFSDHISAIKCWNIWDGREINTGELNRNMAANGRN